jgi:hypothetical protein
MHGDKDILRRVVKRRTAGARTVVHPRTTVWIRGGQFLRHSETQGTHRSLPTTAALLAGGPNHARAGNANDGLGKTRKRTVCVTSCGSHSEGSRPRPRPLPISAQSLADRCAQEKPLPSSYACLDEAGRALRHDGWSQGVLLCTATPLPHALSCPDLPLYIYHVIVEDHLEIRPTLFVRELRQSTPKVEVSCVGLENCT